MKKISVIYIVLSMIILSMSVFTCYAEPEAENTEEAVVVYDDSPAPHAYSAILVDMKSGKVLFSKKETEKLYPASTTKILTAILTLENANLDDVVVAQREAIEPITNKHSHMGILIGEELTVRQLLYGMLVYSANDAANVLAVHISGSIEAFAEMMNNKAAELGAVNSHFVNPHGFHDDNHYTTAQDLSIISLYAMKNETFREIVKTDMYTIDPTNKYKEIRYLSNTNHLVSNRRRYEYVYKKATGIKTGFTDEAGSCLVSSAVDGDTELLAVVMKCKNTTMVNNGSYSFVDSKNLLEYGFDNFKYITIIPNGDIVSDSGVYEAKNDVRVALTPEVDISALLPIDVKMEEIEKNTVLNEKIAAPIEKGDILGTVTCVYKGEIIGTSNLVATNSVQKDYIAATIHLIVKIITHPIVLILIIVIAFVMIRARIIRERKKRMRRSRLQHVDNGYEHRAPRDKYQRRRR